MKRSIYLAILVMVAKHNTHRQTTAENEQPHREKRK